jgi:hypothetical protein
LRGRENNKSIVPVFNSSAKERMVIAGIKNRKNQGLKAKRVERSAAPVSNTLSPKIQKKRPFPVKKTAITT